MSINSHGTFCGLVRATFLCVIANAFVLGCRQRSARVAAPKWQPDRFAAAVMSKLDENGDGLLDKSELAAAPGLTWGANHIDTNSDGVLSREELIARFTMYRDLRVGQLSKSIQLSYRQRPLAGAQVQLSPEFFLEQVMEPAAGETGREGVVAPRIEESDLPGMRVGYYRVVVQSPNVKIPARYGSADTTTLGVEVSPISEGSMSYGTIQLVLTD